MAVKSVKEVVSDLLTRVKKLEDEESGGGGSSSNTVKYVVTTLANLDGNDVTISSESINDIISLDHTTVNSKCGLSLSSAKDIIGLNLFLSGSLTVYIHYNWQYVDEDPGYYTVNVVGYNNNTKNSVTVSASDSTLVIFYKD